MNTSSFLSTLRQHAGRPLVFRAGAHTIAPGYHLTEVKDVSYRTMDCGAMTHRWTETQFELWVPGSAAEAEARGHMPADKFLRIVDRVQQELPLEGDAPARIFAAFGASPAALFDVEGIELERGQLVVALTPDRARCKARERREAELATAGATSGGCGCGTSPAATPAVCCA